MPITDFRITALTFSGGQQIALEPGSLLLLVGPNNAGKSATLREIGTWLAPDHLRVNPVVLNSLEILNPDAVELFGAMKRFYPNTEMPNGSIQFSLPNGGRINFQGTKQPIANLYQTFYQALVQRLDTETRLIYANPAGRRDLFRQEVPEAGIHWLQKDDAIYRKVSAIVRDAFGGDLLINWGGGATVGFHFGDAPLSTTDCDRVSSAYLEQLNMLPRIETLGDGIRSFVATVIAAFVGPHPVVLIDEPEAFLHPPQASRLGQILSKLITESERQAIIATHSADFVRGAIFGSGKVAICRIERKGSVNEAHLLDAAKLQEFWSSPLLRSSQAITGLFHEGIVVCEADADSRFYEGILGVVAKTVTRPLDLYFVHGGGKGALASFAKAYRSAQIATIVIADLDLLKNLSEFFAVFKALGGDCDAVKPLYERVVKQLSSQAPILSASDFIAEVKTIVADIEIKNRLSPEARRKTLALIEEASDWSEAKKYGIDKLKGGARADAKELLEQSKKVGLFLVPQGQLEGWWRDGSAEKAKWIMQALDRLNTNPNDFDDARSFVAEICAYFGYAT